MGDKFIILVGDGMGDYPLDRLGGLTPLEAARTPNLNRLVLIGTLGIVQTIPAGMQPGSDVANMSLLGYDPAAYHTGRGPLEAASIGVRLEPDEVAFRCNLVFLSKDEAGNVVMGDYSAGHISTPEAHEIIVSLQSAVSGSPLKLYAGVSFRQLLVWKGGRAEIGTIPPHDILGQSVAKYDLLSTEPILHAFTEKAARVLEDHPVNMRRKKAGKSPANAVWLWGQGKAPSMPKLDRFGLCGAMISAVDLLKGIGVYAGLDPVKVEGATGYIDTNYEGKVAAAMSALERGNFVFLHVEAPDETSHAGSLEEKIQAIECFDKHIVGPIVEGARKFRKVHLLVATDHFTPISMRTHSTDPVPFLLVDDLKSGGSPSAKGGRYCEKEALAAGFRLESGEDLFRIFIGAKRS
ncbi:MAG TPA: cofactor-independent phosphoglycerate mutase [Deltaproteobacteria bacterium]|jgi:2,3-bisphosphoglycerate-independent phosphoglycerate mutase|nr:cofactor-independent phosphoglycerate mutase [Deltaproteobacteria bacterium]HIJ76991.1 cofactor-independent phosphoglycerate mutase [Deltaproteobacteria bacterium]